MFEHHLGMFAKSGRMPAKSREKPLRLSRPHTCRIFEVLPPSKKATVVVKDKKAMESLDHSQNTMLWKPSKQE